ncbi:MAG: hypothetical protein NC094_05185 [Bacteroidales bacterium]|nr:hypothetical protein [Lachnoclostridium sp.]MCM1384295.1 hypothetical protein [Lachnoclostridium sp.]MCM1464795.1 hypothetical protein [Bacteroidales bacterium]
MDIEIISKQDVIPAFETNAVVVKRIEYYPYGGTYDESQITPELIEKILAEIPHGINIFLFLDPDGECDFMEVLSDGEWLSLACSFDRNGEWQNYYTYNASYADTAEQIKKHNYSDKSVWTALESGGQSPVPKMQAITDMEIGIKAVEYFIRTGELYPGIDWAHQF